VYKLEACCCAENCLNAGSAVTVQLLASALSHVTQLSYSDVALLPEVDVVKGYNPDMGKEKKSLRFSAIITGAS